MDETLTQIEKYWTGKLNPEEMKAFQNKMTKDEAFATEVQLYKDMVGGLRLRNNKLLKNRLDEIHEQVVDSAKTASIKPMRWKYIAAAVLVGLVISLSLLFLQNNRPDFNQIYAANFQAYEADWTTRNADAKTAQLELAKQLYAQEDYTALSNLLEVDSLQDIFSAVKFTMVKGISALELGQFETARNYFDQAATNSLLRADAQWYTALSYLKEGNTDACKSILETFAADETSDYYSEAKDILGVL